MGELSFFSTRETNRLNELINRIRVGVSVSVQKPLRGGYHDWTENQSDYAKNGDAANYADKNNKRI